MSPMDDNPITGKGEEMLPEKGIPFSEIGPAPEPVPTLAALSEDEFLELEEARAADIAAGIAENIEPTEIPGQAQTLESAGLGDPGADNFTDTEDAALDSTLHFSETMAATDLEELPPDEDEIISALVARALQPDLMAEAGFDETSDGRPGIDAGNSEMEDGPGMADSGLGAGFIVPDNALSQIPGTVEPATQPGEAVFTAASFLLPDPMGGQARPQAPLLAGDLEPEKAILDSLITPQKVDELWFRTEEAKRQINAKIDSLTIARQLLDQIRSAKTLILGGHKNYEEAERALNEVEYRLALAERVAGWTKTEARRVLWYEIAWGVAIAVATGANLVLSLDGALTIAIGAAITGGLGGVTGALFSLWRHVAQEQDYSPQYNLWYYTQPLMGLPIGLLIFAFTQLGVVITIPGTATIGNPIVIYTLAAIAGFQQNVAWDIIRQILKMFKLGKNAE